jgi:hypothetical protein
MKHHALVLLSLLFLAVPALASADTAATDLGAPAAEVSAACSAPAGLADVIQVDFRSLAECTALAQCDPFQDVGCVGSDTCSVKDRNCSIGQRGFVKCDGVTTYCPEPCCATNGVCEVSYGCTCENDSPDCDSDPACEECECSEVTNCQSNRDCCTPGSICTPSGICLCAG